MVWKQFFFHQNLQSKAREPFEYSDGKVMQIRAKLLKITPLPHLEVVQNKTFDLVFEGSQYKDKFFSYIIRKCVLKIWPFLSVCSIWPFPSVCLIIEVGNKKRINHNWSALKYIFTHMLTWSQKFARNEVVTSVWYSCDLHITRTGAQLSCDHRPRISGLPATCKALYNKH